MNRIIKEEQLQEVINMLAEMPAKHSFNAIYMLQNLPEIEADKQGDDD